MSLPYGGIWGRNELCDVRDVGGSVWVEEALEERDPESFINFTEARAVNGTVKSFLCSPTTLAGMTSKNICNFELTHFLQKIKVSK